MSQHSTISKSNPNPPSADPIAGIPPWLNLIKNTVDAVDFGTIQIKIHEREVVQIETTRKIRITPSSGKPIDSSAKTLD